MDQYHYCGWPDHGLPVDTSPLMHMLQVARENVALKGASKLLVHCSAGVGRTGTFIALTNLMGMCEQLSKGLFVLRFLLALEQRISVFRTVRLLREQRVMMVERPV